MSKKNPIHGISPDMVIRLSKAFGSTPDTWLQLQLVYDLAKARQHEGEIHVRRYELVPALLGQPFPGC